MKTENVRMNARVIWHLLVANGKLSIRQLCLLSGSEEIKIAMAIGWLAREDRINVYEHGETTYVALTHKIAKLFS